MMGPEMRWLTVHAPGDPLRSGLLVAGTIDILLADRQAMRVIVAKALHLPVFIQVDDFDKTFELLRPPGRRSSRSPSTSPTKTVTPPSATPSGNQRRLS